MPISKVTIVSQVTILLNFAKYLDLKKPAAEEQFESNILKIINSVLLKTENKQQIFILKFVVEQAQRGYAI